MITLRELEADDGEVFCREQMPGACPEEVVRQIRAWQSKAFQG